VSSERELRIVPTQANSLLVNAFTALRDLPKDYPQWVLAGGAAVLVQTAGSHRSTQDLDLLTDASDRAVSMLVGRNGERTTNGATLDGITIDILDVSEGDVDSGSYLAHRHAFDEPDLLTVILRNSSEEFVSLDVSVASVGSLIAMKTHAALDRRLAVPEKRATDTWDLLVLASSFAEELAESLSSLPSKLKDSIVERLEILFGTDLTRSMSLLRGYGGPEVAAVEREDLMQVKQSLIGWLESPRP
jgi:hypothetical protein